MSGVSGDHDAVGHELRTGGFLGGTGERRWQISPSTDLDEGTSPGRQDSIQVAGYLDESWSTRLGGLEITISDPDENARIATLSGSLIDQAALFGVLKTLYDMRLPLLSVECLETNCPSPKST